MHVNDAFLIIFSISISWSLHQLAILIPLQPPTAKELTDKLQTCSDEELVKILQKVTVWRYGKVHDSKSPVLECALIRN